MSRLSRFLLLIVLGMFVLACNMVMQPIKDVKNAASTAESFATTMPLETLQAIGTNLPVQTLEALPSALPQMEMFNPHGTPVTDWNNIPIMSEATDGQEFSSTSYSFAVPSTTKPKDIQDFYDSKLKDLGWSSLFGSTVSDQGGLLLFQKDKALLTITVVTNVGDAKSTVANLQLVSQ